MKTRSNVSSSAVFILFTTLGAALARYAYDVFLAWKLPGSEHGVASLGLFVAGALHQIVSVGVPQSVAKLLSESRESDETSRLVGSAVLMNTIFSLLAGVLAYLLLVPILGLGGKHQTVIAIVCVSTVAVAVGSLYRSALQGRFNFFAYGVIDSFHGGGQLAVGIVLVMVGYGVLGAAAGVLAGALLLMVSGAFFAMRSGILGSFRGNAPTPLLGLSLAMLIGTLAVTWITTVDALGVKLLTRAGDTDLLAGQYRAISVLARTPLILGMSLAAVLFPYISRFQRAGQPNEHAKYLFKYVLLFTVPSAVMLGVLPHPIASLVFPPHLTNEPLALVILAGGISFLTMGAVIATMLQAADRAQLVARIFVLCVLLHTGLLLALTPTGGVMGAATATAIASTVSLVLLAVSGHRLFPGLLNAVNVRFAIAAAAFALVLRVIPHGNPIMLLVDIAAGSAMYLLLLLVTRVVDSTDVDILSNVVPAEPARQKLRNMLYAALETVPKLP